MPDSCVNLTAGIWNPTIWQGETFYPTYQIAVNGVLGYNPLDTFVGWITSEEEAEVVDAVYTFTLTDPVNGLLIPSLTPAQTLGLPKGSLFHSGEWHRFTEGDVIPIFNGRPLIKARAKK